MGNINTKSCAICKMRIKFFEINLILLPPPQLLCILSVTTVCVLAASKIATSATVFKVRHNNMHLLCQLIP